MLQEQTHRKSCFWNFSWRRKLVRVHIGEVVFLKASGVSSFMFSSMHSSSPAELTIIKIFGCIGGKHVSADSTIHASTNPSKITKKTNRQKKKKVCLFVQMWRSCDASLVLKSAVTGELTSRRVWCPDRRSGGGGGGGGDSRIRRPRGGRRRCR